MKLNISNVACALLVALGLWALGQGVRSGLKSIPDSQRVVEVRGLAVAEVAATNVTWPIVFTCVGNELSQVYSDVAATNDKIVEFLTDNDVASADISVGAPTMTDLSADRYNNQPAPYKYNITSVVTVSSSQVDKVRSLINRQGELLQQGIPVQAGDWNHRITYTYDSLNAIKPLMIAEATENARHAATKFAEDSHSSLGKIKNAHQGQFSIDDRDEYTPYIKSVRVVTTLTYYLED